MIILAGTALLYGLRHGIDWDHLAAITDLTSAQGAPRRGLKVASAYAAGHGVVVLVLGIAAILGSEFIPPVIDEVMGRVVGVTLIVLALSVAVGLIRDRRGFRYRSRWMLIGSGLSQAKTWARRRFVEIRHDHPHDHSHGGHGGHGHSHPELVADVVAPGPGAPGAVPARVVTEVQHGHAHRHIVAVPLDPFAVPGVSTAAGIGVLHGIGAETPTQVIVFLTAAHVAGPAAGLALLVCFIVGIFVSNTVVAVASSYGYLNANRSFPLYAAIGVANAAASLVVGTIMLSGGTLPTLLGG